MSISTPDWVTALFAAIDAKDAKHFAHFLAPDAVFRFANQPPVRGVHAIRENVAAFFQSIHALHHEIEETFDHGEVVVCHGKVTYTRRDGSLLTVPFADIFKMHGELIREYLIFMDPSELYPSE